MSETYRQVNATGYPEPEPMRYDIAGRYRYATFRDAEIAARRRFLSGKQARIYFGMDLLAEIKRDNRGIFTELTVLGARHG